MVLNNFKKSFSKLKLPIPLIQKKTLVILDTNFLLLPGSQGIDIFSVIPQKIDDLVELAVVEPSLWELQHIIEGSSKSKTKHGKVKGSDKFNAKLGFVLVKQKGLKVLKPSQVTGFADEAIISFVKKGVFVATLDKDLQKKVLEKQGKVILVRQGKRLEIKA